MIKFFYSFFHILINTFFGKKLLVLFRIMYKTRTSNDFVTSYK
ncbi:hypothetical protein HMP0015_1641 [Acinetobacter haemolyticus ATCC 19194]|uniref:Uncharacterized protein n=1 Tax=Acinetobacter haemolyticus ATCC 19194 TaxID=707232 RepID=D4XPJ9_ACIHA|nr:hypothetical protein HMP0015_1641 [Acinetobacter haemolyticus ATCC 19194]